MASGESIELKLNAYERVRATLQRIFEALDADAFWQQRDTFPEAARTDFERYAQVFEWVRARLPEDALKVEGIRRELLLMRDVERVAGIPVTPDVEALERNDRLLEQLLLLGSTAVRDALKVLNHLRAAQGLTPLDGLESSAN